jgi:hypothetical protein
VTSETSRMQSACQAGVRGSTALRSVLEGIATGLIRTLLSAYGLTIGRQVPRHFRKISTSRSGNCKADRGQWARRNQVRERSQSTTRRLNTALTATTVRFRLRPAQRQPRGTTSVTTGHKSADRHRWKDIIPKRVGGRYSVVALRFRMLRIARRPLPCDVASFWLRLLR